MKRALVLGAGGFIGSHMARRLKAEGYEVGGADLKRPEFSETACDHWRTTDLSDEGPIEEMIVGWNPDEIYQFAADMGGAGYIFTGENDTSVMSNSALINLNLIRALQETGSRPRVFFSSSACVYPARTQMDTEHPDCRESSAYPADPDSEYGWEKLFSERLYLAAERNLGLPVSIARFHNVFGPEGTWRGGKEKAPAAICRKLAEAEDGGTVEIWGDGEQTRSFLFIDECVEAVRRMMQAGIKGPMNIGSEEMVSINDLVYMVAQCAGKTVRLKHIPGPLGVRGRNSHNAFLRSALSWEPALPLEAGIALTYRWIENQVRG